MSVCLQVTGGQASSEVTFPRQCGVSSDPTTRATPLPFTQLLFKTDEVITDRGFNLSYSLHPCGGQLEGPQAFLLSPGGPPSPLTLSGRLPLLLPRLHTLCVAPHFLRGKPDTTHCQHLLFVKVAELPCIHKLSYLSQSLFWRQCDHQKWSLHQLSSPVAGMWLHPTSHHHVNEPPGSVALQSNSLMP